MSDMEKEVEQVEDDEMEEVGLITLSDEDNNEYEFEVLDEIDYKDGHYYALMPTFDLPDQDIESGSTYMNFEAVEDENGDPQLAEVEDEDLLDEIAEIFENNFDAAEEE